MKKKYWIAGATLVAGLGVIALVGKRYILPIVGKITSGFGYRVNPVTGVQEYHNGLDLSAMSGTPVHAPAKGKVVNVYYNSAGGNQLILDHGSIQTGYAHLTKSIVSIGDTVSKGQIVAYTGSTGQVTGPHLHFTVLENYQAVSPLKYFNYTT